MLRRLLQHLTVNYDLAKLLPIRKLRNLQSHLTLLGGIWHINNMFCFNYGLLRNLRKYRYELLFNNEVIHHFSLPDHGGLVCIIEKTSYMPWRVKMSHPLYLRQLLPMSITNVLYLTLLHFHLMHVLLLLSTIMLHLMPLGKSFLFLETMSLLLDYISSALWMSQISILIIGIRIFILFAENLILI